jgi:DNA-binding ferritin-like protein
MPLRKTDKGWFWGSKGPFPTKSKALSVARAAHAHGFKEQVMEQNKVAEFIATVRNSATIAHFMHLQVEGEGSYAKHKALEAYYDAMPDLIDSVAEQIQGAYDVIIAPYPAMLSGLRDPDELAYMQAMRDYVRQARGDLPQDSEIQNEVDEVAKLLNKTCYKLQRLR